jgi:methylated-DNA-protein-cysteine methyltransferase-like protein
MTNPSLFSKQVIFFIKKIPQGQVATYKQIASLAGKPHASRAVAWILHSSTKAHKLPWYRVLSSRGQISFAKSSKNFLQQKKYLQKEGVRFLEDGKIDLTKFQWKKQIRPSRNMPKMFSKKSDAVV